MLIIRKYFPSLTPGQVEQFAQLATLYNYWNEKINVISRKDIDNLYLHHVLHSLALSRVITFKAGATIIDAGTGGGFPGIPLAILFPDVRFLLTDSIAKKIRVVEAVCAETGLQNCEIRHTRMEDLKASADFIVSRAVAEIPVLFGWVRKNIIPGGIHNLKNGLLALKGGDIQDELKSIPDRVQVFNLGDFFEEEYFKTKKLVHLER